ncbi:LexA family protein [Enterococcus sp. DIV0800]|uniref:LexA family protein n=2 Tax=unclassified Enterococcus TaxID=2608891 RepID=UPI003D2FD88C
MTGEQLSEDQLKVAAIMKQARKGKKLSQLEVAPKLGLNNATLSKYENGKLPFPDSILIKLSNMYDIDYYSLPGVVKPRLVGSRETMQLIGTIVAGKPLVTYSDPEDIQVPAEIKEAYPNGYLLEASGDSMNRLFPDGQLLVVDPDSEVESGLVYAVRINGDETTVKRVIVGKNLLVLQPDSYDERYKPWMIDDPLVLSEVCIEGKIVWDFANPNKRKY